jgi:pimeloyl-ACP methyl ester carboxylesterase
VNGPAGALPESARQLAARALRAETPCGDGSLVWHLWGQGPPVVLLHGGSGSWSHWLRNIEALAASGRRVVVPDMPGFGSSARSPRGDDADALPPLIETGLAQLLGATACELVGFSFGGLTAGLLARAMPERVRRLVLVGAPAMGLWPGRQTLELASWRHLADPAERRAIHRRNLGILMLHDTAAIDETTVAMQQFNVERDRTKGRFLARTDALALALQKVRCPVDAIYGEHDALYRQTMDDLATRFEALPRFGRFVRIEDAGHWVQYERAEAFNAALAELLGPATAP